VLTIGFIGTGNMGEFMVANLAKAGFAVTVHDQDAARAEALAARTGVKSGQLADVAKCNICVTMLPTSKIVSAVLFDQDGGAFINAAAPGTIVIDMSSSEPEDSRTTAARLGKQGIIFMDAPVSGGVVRAQTGTLTIMVGCDDADAVEAARPALAAMGERIFLVGKVGGGDAMKAANNFVAAASYAALAEALAMGKAFGLDPSMMVDIINLSTGRSFNSEVVMKDHVVTGRFDTGFAIGLLAKDVGIAAVLGEQQGVDAPLSQLVRARYADAVAKVGFGADNSEAICGWYGSQWENANVQ
jgi:3-hydroxyisobutyrate dehydrogenase